MRKNFAIAMVALLALTVAFAVMSCGGKKAEETPPPAPAEQSAAPADTTMQMGSDTTMAH